MKLAFDEIFKLSLLSPFQSAEESEEYAFFNICLLYTSPVGKPKAVGPIKAKAGTRNKSAACIKPVSALITSCLLYTSRCV